MQVDNISDALCRQLGKFIAHNTGLHFPPERHADLQRGIASAAEEFGFPDPAQCASWLLSAPLSQPQLRALASHLTVGETYFFRERKTFGALAEHILPELLRRRRGCEQRLRLWSAACCTGEEPYSLAILVHELLGDARDWDVTILATDINQQFLKKAEAGVYGEWSFRESANGLKERYFTRSADGRFTIAPAIRKRVSFVHMNLARVPLLEIDVPAMDIILCRNVLMYFTPTHARKLVESMYRALADEGWLAVGMSECSQTLFSRFAPVNFRGAIVYRKQPLEVQSLGACVPEPTDTAQTANGPEPANPSDLSDLLDPDPPVSEPGLLSVRARALANEGRLTDALACSERWIAADKVDWAAHYLRAMIFRELGENEAARCSLNRVIYLEPDCALAHFALGNLARADARNAEANKHFENALHVLRGLASDEPLPESDGMTAGGLAEIIVNLMEVSK